MRVTLRSGVRAELKKETVKVSTLTVSGTGTDSACACGQPMAGHTVFNKGSNKRTTGRETPPATVWCPWKGASTPSELLPPYLKKARRVERPRAGVRANAHSSITFDLRYGAYAPTQDEGCRGTAEPVPSEVEGPLLRMRQRGLFQNPVHTPL